MNTENHTALNCITNRAAKPECILNVGDHALTEGSGIDVLVCKTTPNTSSNKDSITDFASANEGMWLGKSVITGFGANTELLSAGAIWSCARIITSHTSTDRISYKSTTGALYCDADGNGVTAAV
jgi:Ca2+-binding RTX toxin-like protein